MSNEGSLVVVDGFFLSFFLGINFLYFVLFFFIFCVVILMVVSKFSEVLVDKDLFLVIFQERDGIVCWQWSIDVVFIVVLIGLVLILWLIFSFWGIV